jgi:DNA-binding IclR family transcriptional regulator
VADRQFQIDALGVAAPIFAPDGTVRAAVSVGGSRSLPVWDDLGKIIRLVKESAGEISKRISRPLMMEPETPRPVSQASQLTRPLG